MITLFAYQEEELDEQAVQALSRLWDKPFQNLDAFFELDEDDFKDFDLLLFESLTDRCVLIDWKWGPEDIFWQLERSLPDFRISLTSAVDPETREGDYKITFTINGVNHSLDVPWANPDVLLDYINNLITPRSFIHLNYRDDTYRWLLIPANFDIARFCQIAGMTQNREDLKKQTLPQDLAINPSGKQSAKIFFRPKMFLYKNGQKFFVEYTHGSWAGRILPGQTIKEGVATELQKELDYTGDFTIGNIQFTDYGTDRKGNKIERHAIEITLHNEPTIAAGMKIVLVES